MITGLGSTLAGLNVFGKKTSNAAGNVANSVTDGYKKTRADIVEDNNGLPTVDVVQINTPGSLIPDSEGNVRESSNVDLSEEIGQMIVAQRGYEANLKAFKIQDETLGSLFDIIA